MATDATERTSSSWARVSFASVSLLLPVCYVAGYFVLGKPDEFFIRRDWVAKYRVYPSKPIAVCFRPLAKLEGWLRGQDCRVGWRDELQFGTFVDPP